MSIRARLFLLVLSAVAPLLALLAIGAINAHHAALEETASDMRRFARTAGERRSQAFEGARILLSTLRAAPGVTAMGSSVCIDVVAQAVANNPVFMTVGVVDAEGVVVCHSRRRVGHRFTDVDIFKAAAVAVDKDRLLVGRMVVGKITGQPTIVGALPLTAADGGFGGLVFAGLDLSRLSLVADDWRKSSTSVFVIDASEGKVVAASGSNGALINRSFAGHPLIEAMRASPKGGSVVTRGLTGREEIIGFAPLDFSGLSTPMAVVAAPRDEALAPVQSATRQRLAIAVALSALVLGAAWLIGFWTLARPIGELTLAARRLGEGRLASRIVIEAWQAPELRLLGSTFNDMADRLDDASHRLEALANEDALTGLANRRKFDAALTSECARAERERTPLSLLLVDIDHFKAFNDTYGHLAGDVCLKRIAECVVATATRTEDLAARYGGEELALILPNTDEEGARAVAERLIARVRALGHRHATSPRRVVTVSIGATTASPGLRELLPEKLIGEADAALYEAKSAGRDAIRSRRTTQGLRLVADVG